MIKKHINKNDIIIVADYGHGIITEKIRKLILSQHNKLFLNTQINSFNRGYHTVFKYKKINTLVINDSELRYEIGDKNSSILIFDESTSALDEKTETKIFNNIKKYLKDKIVIFISHNKKNIKYFNKVLVLDNGKLIQKEVNNNK